MLNIFEPTIAPTAISAWPLIALVTDAANSRQAGTNSYDGEPDDQL